MLSSENGLIIKELVLVPHRPISGDVVEREGEYKRPVFLTLSSLQQHPHTQTIHYTLVSIPHTLTISVVPLSINSTKTCFVCPVHFDVRQFSLSPVPRLGQYQHTATSSIFAHCCPWAQNVALGKRSFNSGLVSLNFWQINFSKLPEIW